MNGKGSGDEGVTYRSPARGSPAHSNPAGRRGLMPHRTPAPPGGSTPPPSLRCALSNPGGKKQKSLKHFEVHVNW